MTERTHYYYDDDISPEDRDAIQQQADEQADMDDMYELYLLEQQAEELAEKMEEEKRAREEAESEVEYILNKNFYDADDDYLNPMGYDDLINVYHEDRTVRKDDPEEWLDMEAGFEVDRWIEWFDMEIEGKDDDDGHIWEIWHKRRDKVYKQMKVYYFDHFRDVLIDYYYEEYGKTKDPEAYQMMKDLERVAWRYPFDIE